ncbi:MAG: DUF2807 domain-containing protein, partial [Pseudomonadota bacterium]
MKKRFVAAGAAVSLASLMVLSASAETKTYDVASFTGVKVSNGISVDITVGGAQSIEAEASTERLERLRIDSDDGVLRIRLKRKNNSGWNWGNSGGNVNVAI